VTALLLILLSACSTTKTEIKYLTIPDVYIHCNYLPTPNISDSAYEEAEDGDYKTLALELVQDRFAMEKAHNECVRNMEAIYKYQQEMLKKD